MSIFVTSLKRLQIHYKGRPVYCRSSLFALFLTISALLLIVSLLASCAPVRPKLVGESVDQSFADGLMQEWFENSAQVTSVQGLAKVKVHTPEKSLNGTQVILAEKPNRLRAETLSPFGSPLLLLAADGKNLGVSLPSRNTFYTGESTAANLGRFVRIPLRLTDLISVLLYQPPMIDPLNEEAFELQQGGWLLVRYSPSRRQELTFNHAHQLVEVSYYNQDELFLKINYGQFSEDGSHFPQLFSIELPEAKTTASLKFSDLETNGTLRPGIFQLAPPEGATVISLDDK
jgi:outer membrane lipoprotein-sorting protein